MIDFSLADIVNWIKLTIFFQVCGICELISLNRSKQKPVGDKKLKPAKKPKCLVLRTTSDCGARLFSSHHKKKSEDWHL